MAQTLSTILTIVIAIGAIWAAFASTRQAQYSRRLASAAERNVGEQIRSFQEQNERARLSFEVDMLFRLEDRFNSQRLVDSRRRAAKYVKDNFFTPDGGMLEVQHVHPDALQLLVFFEEVGHLKSMGVLRDETVWYRFGRRIRTYWALYQPAVEKIRQEAKDPMVMEDFERLNALMADIDRQHGVGDEETTPQHLRRFIEDELASTGEESPTQAP
jgi:hypothetical protein